MTGSERRGAQRVSMMGEVNYDGQSSGHQCRISDISRTGVFIDTMSPLSVGARLRFIFSLSNTEPIAAEGKVVHSQRGIGMGLEFTSLSNEGTYLLRRILGGPGTGEDVGFSQPTPTESRNEAA